MAGSKNWKKAAKESMLDKMHTDITKIVADFSPIKTVKQAWKLRLPNN